MNINYFPAFVDCVTIILIERRIYLCMIQYTRKDQIPNSNYCSYISCFQIFYCFPSQIFYFVKSFYPNSSILSTLNSALLCFAVLFFCFSSVTPAFQIWMDVLLFNSCSIEGRSMAELLCTTVDKSNLLFGKRISPKPKACKENHL